MSVLFSCVGHSDPISNEYDGPLLHICRYYKPEHVYLYYTEEIFRIRQGDLAKNTSCLFDRYEYNIYKLGERINHSFNIIPIYDNQNTIPHEFDPALGIFNSMVEEIRRKHAHQTIYLNVSSGTPAMKGALQILSVLDRYSQLKAIQVTSPVIGFENIRENEREFQIQAELNYDDRITVNRCSSLQSNTKNYLYLVEKEDVRILINRFDYHGAKEIVKQNQQMFPEAFVLLLDTLIARYTLNDTEVKKLNSKLEPNLKIHQKSIASEYLLLQDLRLIEKNEISEYLRGLSPILTDLFWRVVSKIDPGIKNYLQKRKSNVTDLAGLKWSSSLASNLELQSQIFGDDKNPFTNYNFAYVKNFHLANLIEARRNELHDDELADAVKALRTVERELRNPVAHQMVAFDEYEIKKVTGFPIKQIHKYLKFVAIRMNVINENDLNSYREINSKLLDLL